MPQDHALPVTRLWLCPVLAAAYYEPVSDCSRRDAEVVAALNEIVCR